MASTKPAAGGSGAPASAKPRLTKPDQEKYEKDVAAFEQEAKIIEANINATEAEILAKQASSAATRVRVG